MPREGVKGCAARHGGRARWWQASPSPASFVGQRAPSGIATFRGASCCSFPFRRVFGECVSGRLCLSAAPAAIVAPRRSPTHHLMGYVLHEEGQLLEAHQGGNGEVFLSASSGMGHHIHKCQCGTEVEPPSWALWCRGGAAILGAEAGLPSQVPQQGGHLRYHGKAAISGTLSPRVMRQGGCGATPHGMVGAMGDFRAGCLNRPPLPRRPGGLLQVRLGIIRSSPRRAECGNWKRKLERGLLSSPHSLLPLCLPSLASF